MSGTYKMKGVIESEDDGETWYVYRIDYVTVADDPHGKFDFTEEHNFDSMVLKRVQ